MDLRLQETTSFAQAHRGRCCHPKAREGRQAWRDCQHSRACLNRQRLNTCDYCRRPVNSPSNCRNKPTDKTLSGSNSTDKHNRTLNSCPFLSKPRPRTLSGSKFASRRCSLSMASHVNSPPVKSSKHSSCSPPSLSTAGTGTAGTPGFPPTTKFCQGFIPPAASGPQTTSSPRCEIVPVTTGLIRLSLKRAYAVQPPLPRADLK